MSYIHAIGMKTLQKSLKNKFPTILNVSGHFRPIPATYGPHILDQQKSKKSRKITKIDILSHFSKIDIL